jgi:hypothetical protein
MIQRDIACCMAALRQPHTLLVEYGLSVLLCG